MCSAESVYNGEGAYMLVNTMRIIKVFVVLARVLKAGAVLKRVCGCGSVCGCEECIC